jgi:predicted outer membrane repeat protein
MANFKWNWFQGDSGDRSAATRRDRPRRRVGHRVEGLESLEGRTLLSNVYTVVSLGDTGAGLGRSGDLRYCITKADTNPGSTVRFGVAGTISLTNSLPDLSANMSIIGPGAAGLTVRLSPANLTPKGLVTVDRGVTARLSGVTFSGGNTATGGAINNYGTLSVSNAVFSGNTANRGAGIANNPGAVLHVSNSTFTGETASYAGGGIDNLKGTVTVSGSRFDLNLANGIGGFGAGIANESGSMTVIGSTFSQGLATGGGGGIYNSGGTLTASHDTFTDNEALRGGGLLNIGVAKLDYMTFDNNKASSGGAISNGTIDNASATLTLDNSYLTRNWADDGGGIANYAVLTVATSSIVHNQVGMFTGGGIENNGSLTIIDSSITGNTNEWGMPDNISGNPPRYE